MWTIVYIARDKDITERIKQALTETGIIYKVRENNSEIPADYCCEFLVPDAEVSLAHGIIIDIGF